MANQTAEIIDLKTYREEKAAQHRAAGADAFAYNAHAMQTPLYQQAPLSPFAMPVAFFVFWPAWVFTPQVASVSDRGGSGAA